MHHNTVQIMWGLLDLSYMYLTFVKLNEQLEQWGIYGLYLGMKVIWLLVPIGDIW
ncbi:hypothetical protein BT96DRAFT_1005574 [Gymnopus androsaceus JB14]|uniref:Uncharacterized protein n=1 Tax=Gymnopus androsaceus JB14 TaxID=1447944 RepID=A0A6A4GNQ8_9AGAR|nr:hypothetical protein BT96DRAFT_1005574 [Gymnopus androsaceus JB14]